MQLRPKHMLQGRLHLAQMRPREGRLKITNRGGMAERQAADEMKAATHSSRLPPKQTCTTASDGQTSFIDLFYFSDRIRFESTHIPDG